MTDPIEREEVLKLPENAGAANERMNWLKERKNKSMC